MDAIGYLDSFPFKMFPFQGRHPCIFGVKILSGSTNIYTYAKIYIDTYAHMSVSKNRGTPKWMVYNGKSKKMDDLGVPPFTETPIYIYTKATSMHLCSCIWFHSTDFFLLSRSWKKMCINLCRYLTLVIAHC